MPTEEPTRKFNPSSVPGLSTEARKAVNATFEAMSSWRTETVNTSERGIEQVIEKMAEAARALGWPKQGLLRGYSSPRHRPNARALRPAATCAAGSPCQ